MMLRLSIQKTRALFVLFFFALAIPSGILSYKAHEQLKWQTARQYQLEAQALVEQIDRELQNAIAKEGVRPDTDYTFFVLAGSPEARLVQRSELAKYPVESDLPGVIGYFQVDDKGTFSSPILPSDYVQSAVHSQLYGISVSENNLRKALQNTVAEVLSKNRLVIRTNLDRATSKPVSPLKDSLVNEQYEEKADRGLGYISRFGESERSNGSERVITGSRLMRDKASKERSKSENAGSFEGKQVGFSGLAAAERNKKSIGDEGTSNEVPAVSVLNKESKATSANVLKKRKRSSRTEKNYSPQQLIPQSRQPASRQFERRLSGSGQAENNQPGNFKAEDKIQISLFESKIEPFKFSLLESGHFVMYRQVWQNEHRLFQGAVVSAKDFITDSIIDRFDASLLDDITDLQISYAGEVMQTAQGMLHSYVPITKQTTQRETLFSMSLAEPFGQFGLTFIVNRMPFGAGTSFINVLALSLLTVLVIGTYLLYRITLKQSNLAQQQQDFVSSVSHELKTPLTSIRMYGEILKQGWASDEKKEEYYDYIYNESERLSRLIANVLQISKVSHSALDLNLETIEISEMVSLLKSKLDSQIERNGFTLEIDIDGELNGQALSIDSDAFVQIIINLVDNAVKYSKNADKKQIDIAFRLNRKNKVQISVRDYGPGIAKSQVKKIFELFYRSGDELTRTSTGTGIGLALVKELAMAMGAEVEAINQQPGVIFSILFPLRR